MNDLRDQLVVMICHGRWYSDCKIDGEICEDSDCYLANCLFSYVRELYRTRDPLFMDALRDFSRRPEYQDAIEFVQQKISYE